MGDERAAQAADPLPVGDELLELVLGLVDASLHRAGVELLELDLDLLERLEIPSNDPVEQIREELGAVDPPVSPEPSARSRKLVEHRHVGDRAR